MAEKLKHNSPDETKYHESGDIPGTMLPRAAKDGQSMAFDPNQPQTVIVDPGEAGGGFSVDMATFSKVKGQFNKSASKKETLEDPSAFYKEASKLKTETATTQKPRTVEAAPVTSTPAYKAIDPIQPLNPSPQELSSTVESMLEEEKRKTAEAETLKEQMAVQAAAPSSAQPGFVAGPDPRVLAALDQQAQVLNQVIAAVNQISTASEEKKSASSFTQEAEQAVQSQPQEESYVEEEPVERAKTKIEFLDADKPGRPQYETYFEMSKMGTMAARYHAVVEGKDCLALIYDTRFEDGFQYLPPSLGEERITVTVPQMKDKSYTCSSLGLNWSLGCLDVVILIKHEDN